MIRFVPSNEMKVDVHKSQEHQISRKEKIKQNTLRHDTISFDVYDDSKLIGFVMLREFEKRKFFLWNFAIDKNFQNKGLGTQVLRNLICFLNDKHQQELRHLTAKYGQNLRQQEYLSLLCSYRSLLEFLPQFRNLKLMLLALSRRL